jgi:hypothetical protein
LVAVFFFTFLILVNFVDKSNSNFVICLLSLFSIWEYDGDGEALKIADQLKESQS